MKKYLLYVPAVFVTLACILSILTAAFPAATTISQIGPQIENGVIAPLQPQTAMRIVNDAATGCPDCFRWTKYFEDGTQGFMFAKSFKGLWGFVNLGSNENTWTNVINCGGNATNCETFKNFVAYLESNGWSKIDPGQLPDFIAKKSATMLAAYNTLKYINLATLTTRETFFIVVPPSVFGSEGEKFFAAKAGN